MKISTEINSIARVEGIGEEKAVEMCAKAGFDAWDFSLFSMALYDWQSGCVFQTDHPLRSADYLAFARRLKQIGLDNGIVCNQSHAPFPVNDAEVRSYLKRAIECTAEAGGKICVIHPDNNKSADENAELFNELLPFAKGCGVKIATENMLNWSRELDHHITAACCTPQSFNDHLDAVDSEWFVACLDLGHAEIFGSETSAVEMIKALGPRLAALHIHDNNKRFDQHKLPFTADIQFEPIVRALKDIGYNGYFTMEADTFMKGYTADNAFDGVKILAQTARRLADMYDNK